MFKKAFSLALTLWIVAIISLVSALYLTYGKKVVDKTIKLEKKINIIFETESTIELLKFYIMTGEIINNRVDNKLLKKNFPKLPSTLFIDGRKTLWNQQVITLQDTAGLIGLADTEAIANSLILSENDSKDKKVIIQNSMNDWLDENKIPLLNGAEDAFYIDEKYKPRDENYFAAREEIFLVRGVSDISIIKKEELMSKLIASNYILRNLLTMDINLLGKIYNLSKIEVEQLIKAKSEGKNSLLTMFYTLRPKAFNNESIGISPSRIIQLSVFSETKELAEKIKLLISFRPKESHAFEVLEYNN